MRTHIRLSAWPPHAAALLPSSRAFRRITAPAHHAITPRQQRYATTLASRTALNPTVPTPKVTAPLHEALAKLNAHSPELLDQARLSLCQRGLESPRPTLRIGVLGIGDTGFDAARRIVRLLLADPLEAAAAWEARLLEAGDGAVLVRYEEDGDMEGNGMLKVVGARARVLEREGVEVLVARVEEGFEAAGVEGVVVPVLQSPLAGSGRAGFVRFPVHRALVLGEGIKGALAVGRLEERIEEKGRGLVDVAVDMKLEGARLDGIDTTNVEGAERAFDRFRADVSTGPAFTDAWQSSGLSRLSEIMFSKENDKAETGLRPALKAQLLSLLTSSKARLTQVEVTTQAEVTSRTVPDARRETLQSAITAWSEYAHTDLRNSLTYAFESRVWRRTGFPRVLWRIDDVSASGSEVLYSNFLVETETYLAFLTGRIGEAGFFSANETTKVASSASPPSFTSSAPALSDEELETQRRARLSPSNESLFRLDTLSARLRAETGIDASVNKPWPRGIEITRQTLLRTLLPALHARAQALVLQWFGTVGGTSALAIWYVVATAGNGLYEAGAVAGLGLVWALRRLQRLWGEERTRFEGEVREQGRIVLGEIENTLRGVVRDSRRPTIKAEDAVAWKEARTLLDTAKQELNKL